MDEHRGVCDAFRSGGTKRPALESPKVDGQVRSALGVLWGPKPPALGDAPAKPWRPSALLRGLGGGSEASRGTPGRSSTSNARSLRAHVHRSLARRERRAP